jgi:hypothetical protein
MAGVTVAACLLFLCCTPRPEYPRLVENVRDGDTVRRVIVLGRDTVRLSGYQPVFKADTVYRAIWGPPR